MSGLQLFGLERYRLGRLVALRNYHSSLARLRDKRAFRVPADVDQSVCLWLQFQLKRKANRRCRGGMLRRRHPAVPQPICRDPSHHDHHAEDQRRSTRARGFRFHGAAHAKARITLLELLRSQFADREAGMRRRSGFIDRRSGFIDRRSGSINRSSGFIDGRSGFIDGRSGFVARSNGLADGRCSGSGDGCRRGIDGRARIDHRAPGFRKRS